MKKFIALALSLVLAFGLLTGCGAEKTNTLKVAMLRRDKNGMFAPGRFVMTCCVDDIQFCGLPCKWAAAKELKSRSWVMVEATIAAEKHRLYHGDMGPVLTAISVTPAAPAVEDVCTF